MSKTVSVDGGKRWCSATVDYTDMSIYERTLFDAKWYSHKTNGAVVRYEVAVSLSGELVWVNGPYRAGQYSDLKIFRERLYNELLPNEVVIADAL